VSEASVLAALEAELGKVTGGRHAVAVDGEAAGLRLALRAFGIVAGDEVVVPSFGPACVAAAVREAGGVPVYADIEPTGYGLDPGAVVAAVGPRTVAVVVTHPFGHPAAVADLVAVAQRHGLALLEYGGRSYGAALDDRPVGSFGVLGVFGAGVVTPDPGLAERVRAGRQEAGAPAAAVAEAAWRELCAVPDDVARRRARARVLDATLRGVGVPVVRRGALHVYERYVVRIPGNGRPDRDAFARALVDRGVPVGVPVPVPVHRLAPHAVAEELPWSEAAAGETLELPLSGGRWGGSPAKLAAVCNRLGGLLAGTP
jgi:perosamine synthetase